MTVREKLYNEIYRQTERRLEAQLDAAVARDQRAFVITGFSVVSSGLAGRAAELLGSWLFAVAAMLAMLAAIAGALSAFHREFFGAGYEFKQLSPVIERVGEYEVFLASMAAKNDEYIVKNERSEYRAANLYRASILLFLFGALVGACGLMSEIFPV